MKTINVGSILKEFVENNEVSPKWLAEQLCCHRTNLYKIFKKQHIDTFTIQKFCEALGHNFFADIAEQYAKHRGKETASKAR